MSELRGVVKQAVDAMQAAENNSVEKLNAAHAKHLFWRDWKQRAIGIAISYFGYGIAVFVIPFCIRLWYSAVAWFTA